MTKTELNLAIETKMQQTKNALQTIYDALNQGQQKKIVKNKEVKKLFDLYNVEYQE